MMPIIQPMRSPTVPLTEYKREQEHYARLKVELQVRQRARRPIARFLTAIRSWFARGRASGLEVAGPSITRPEGCSRIVLPSGP